MATRKTTSNFYLVTPLGTRVNHREHVVVRVSSPLGRHNRKGLVLTRSQRLRCILRTRSNLLLARRAQQAAFNHALFAFGGVVTEFLALFDTDEFLTPAVPKNFMYPQHKISKKNKAESKILLAKVREWERVGRACNRSTS